MIGQPAPRRLPERRRQRLQRAALGIVGAAVLALVFLSYLRPAFALDLASRIMLCF